MQSKCFQVAVCEYLKFQMRIRIYSVICFLFDSRNWYARISEYLAATKHCTDFHTSDHSRITISGQIIQILSFKCQNNNKKSILFSFFSVVYYLNKWHLNTAIYRLGPCAKFSKWAVPHTTYDDKIWPTTWFEQSQCEIAHFFCLNVRSSHTNWSRLGTRPSSISFFKKWWFIALLILKMAASVWKVSFPKPSYECVCHSNTINCDFWIYDILLSSWYF